MTDIDLHEEHHSETFHAIAFRVHDEEYGLPLSEIRELVPVPKITRIPRSSPYIRGVINLHGNVIPVFDLAQRIGIGNTKIGTDSKLIIIDIEGEIVAVLAESVTKVSSISEEDYQFAPSIVSAISDEFIHGVICVNNRFIIFADLRRVFAMEAIDERIAAH